MGFAPRQSLSARLLLLTVGFVMLAEILIYVPSVAAFRRDWLEDRLDMAQIAALALEATANLMISDELAGELLENAGVEAVVLQRAQSRQLILGDDMPGEVARAYDLRLANVWSLVRDAAYDMFLLKNHMLIQVTGDARQGSGEYIQILMYPDRMRRDILRYSWNVLAVSVVLSLSTAVLVYLTLDRLLVRPIRRITRSVIAFRQAPEAVPSRIVASTRRDEIGTVERELAAMQSQLRASLTQKTRLANLGTAVAKIHHDLRNILANAQLLSDRLVNLRDPLARSLAPRVTTAIDRAIRLCSATLTYGQAPEAEPKPEVIRLHPLVEDVALSLGIDITAVDINDGAVHLRNEVAPDLSLSADPDQLFRVLLNLMRNAQQALEQGVQDRPRIITVSAEQADEDRLVITIADTGPGLMPRARDHLFQPFQGSATAGGTGLGLAIAKELVEAHGGRIELGHSGPDGTRFLIHLPARGHAPAET